MCVSLPQGHFSMHSNNNLHILVHVSTLQWYLTLHYLKKIGKSPGNIIIYHDIVFQKIICE